MILCCAYALRLLKQNEQLKKKNIGSKRMKIKERALKKIILFLWCFRLEKCIQLPAAGKRKFSLLLPVIFCFHSHPSPVAAEWHGIYIKYHQKEKERRKRVKQRLKVSSKIGAHAFKSISSSLIITIHCCHWLFLYFPDTGISLRRYQTTGLYLSSFKVLGWPKSSLGFFHNILWKKPQQTFWPTQ